MHEEQVRSVIEKLLEKKLHVQARSHNDDFIEIRLMLGEKPLGDPMRLSIDNCRDVGSTLCVDQWETVKATDGNDQEVSFTFNRGFEG